MTATSIPQIAVFASGSGTNAENLARHFNVTDPHARVRVLLANKAGIGAIGRMEALGVETLVYPNDVWAHNPRIIIDALRERGIDVIALAGFLRVVHPDVIRAFTGRIANIHPSLLPAYGGKGMYGMHVHRAVIEAGESRSGATVHLVTDEVDGGEIIMQEAVDIAPGDTPESLAAKIHIAEMHLYPAAMEALLLRLRSDN